MDFEGACTTRGSSVVGSLTWSCLFTAGLERCLAVLGVGSFDHAFPLGMGFEGTFAGVSQTLGTIRHNTVVHPPYSAILAGRTSRRTSDSPNTFRCLPSCFRKTSLVCGLPVVASSDGWNRTVGYCAAHRVHEVNEVVQVRTIEACSLGRASNACISAGNDGRLYHRCQQVCFDFLGCRNPFRGELEHYHGRKFSVCLGRVPYPGVRRDTRLRAMDRFLGSRQGM